MEESLCDRSGEFARDVMGHFVDQCKFIMFVAWRWSWQGATAWAQNPEDTS